MTIKELRLMKGMTLAAFAKSIGIGMSTLTGYEAGKREPGAKALAAIKEVYGVDLATASPVPAPTSEPVEAATEAAPAEKKTRKPRAKKEAVSPAPAEEKVEKKARKPRAKKEAVAPAPAEEKVEKKARKLRAKKEAVTAPSSAPAEEKAEEKVEKKAKKTASIIIQSAKGGEITPEEILSRVGDVDKVYVRPDQNAIYWVKGEETGAINIW